MTFDDAIARIQAIRAELDTLEDEIAAHFDASGADSPRGDAELDQEPLIDTPDELPVVVGPPAKGRPLYSAELEGGPELAAAERDGQRPSSSTPQRRAATPRRYRVVYGSGDAKLPGVPEQVTIARSRAEAEQLKRAIELSHPGWLNLLAIVEE